MIDGRSKGKSFERQVAKELSAWSGIELGRVPMSGAGVFRKADVWPLDTTADFPLAVECKKEEGWDFDQILNGAGSFFNWRIQVERECREMLEMTGRRYLPMLVFSRNRCPIYVALRSQGVNIDGIHFLTLAPLLPVGGYGRYVILKLSDFIRNNPYAHFIQDALERGAVDAK